ncbi:MAG: hypothetical protein ACKOCQ_03465 [Candidatus Nitrosotenuis sp.]
MNDKSKIALSIVILIAGLSAYYVFTTSDLKTVERPDQNELREIPVDGSLFKVFAKPVTFTSNPDA